MDISQHSLFALFLPIPCWLSGKKSSCQHRRCRRQKFNPWVTKIPWRKKKQPPPVFLPGEFHGQRRLVGKSMRSQNSWIRLSDYTASFHHTNIPRDWIRNRATLDTLWPLKNVYRGWPPISLTANWSDHPKDLGISIVVIREEEKEGWTEVSQFSLRKEMKTEGNRENFLKREKRL